MLSGLDALLGFLVFCAAEVVLWFWVDAPFTVVLAGQILAFFGIAGLSLLGLKAIARELTRFVETLSRLLEALRTLLRRWRALWKDLWH